MTRNGTTKASWSSSSGTHVMTVTEAFMALPRTKPHLVGAQIHDGEDDVTTIRLEGTNLWITEGDNSHRILITSAYRLGTKFTVRYVVTGAKVHVYYNGVWKATFNNKYFTGAYFKAGAYTQANCSNSSPCSTTNYGETFIYGLSVQHS